MKLDDMLSFQETIRARLEEVEIFPFSIVSTLAAGRQGLCSITLTSKLQLEDFLNYLDYNSQCDKSGYLIIEETNTVLLDGIALVRFYSML